MVSLSASIYISVCVSLSHSLSGCFIARSRIYGWTVAVVVGVWDLIKRIFMNKPNAAKHFGD